MKQASVFIILSVFIWQSSSKPNSDRVVEEKPLSSSQHYDADGKHNPDYDHDAFLGEGDKKSWDDLTPEESKAKLGTIVDKIDEDKDGSLTATELKKWIGHQQNKFVNKDVERFWKVQDQNQDGLLTWQEYNDTIYSGLSMIELMKLPEANTWNFAKKIRREKARWAAADVNKDLNLSREEFVGFMHPEEREHMFDVYIDEQLEDVDKNNDKLISIDEYIDDIRKGGDVTEEVLERERESFKTHHDRNDDGYMDHGEFREWILPSSYDTIENEAKHLIYEVDKDDDQMLSRQEILDEWKTFVPSRALLAERDEL